MNAARATSLRIKADLTQEEAASLLGYSRLTIARWELGTRTMDAAQSALYRARVALLQNDEATALKVLREALPKN